MFKLTVAKYDTVFRGRVKYTRKQKLQTVINLRLICAVFITV